MVRMTCDSVSALLDPVSCVDARNMDHEQASPDRGEDVKKADRHSAEAREKTGG